MSADVATLEYLNGILATGGLIALAFAALCIFDMHKNNACASFIRAWGLTVAFAISAVATCFTLIYSEFFGIVPCGLCWLERMALYPQLVLIPVALYYKDERMPRSGIALSVIGLLISLYHHYVQMGGTEFISCPTSGADCAKRFMFEYGFVTFPFLSAILFACLIALYLYILKTNRTEG